MNEPTKRLVTPSQWKNHLKERRVGSSYQRKNYRQQYLYIFFLYRGSFAGRNPKMNPILTAVPRTIAVLLGLTLLIAQAHAQQLQRAKTTNYQIPSDVVSSGGGDGAKSTNYLLDDTIGESNIGFGRSLSYDLNAGYRQPNGGTYLALTCDPITSLGTITFTGQATADGTCTVVTDNDAGYALTWQVRTGSGGVGTGYLISTTPPHTDRIAPFSPTVPGTPQTWSVAANTARWGGRLRSSSTDTDVKWGTDLVSDKWLNVGTGSYTVVSRSSRTSVSGSVEVFQYRTEVAPNAIVPNGLYQTTVTLTASAL